MLLTLPGSATCTTDFSDFSLVLVRFFVFWGGVSYFPEFLKLSISHHAAPGKIRLRGGGKG